MGFKLTSFASLSLGQHLGRSDNARRVRDSTVRLPGGILDTYGSTQQRPEAGRGVTHSFILHDNAGAMDTNWKALNAKLGAKGSLVRTWADTTTQFTSARLMTLDAVKESAEYIAATATFQLLEDHWNGTYAGKALDDPDTPWVLDDGEDLDSGYGAQKQTGFTSGYISLGNSGNMAVTDAVIEVINEAGAEITRIAVQQNDASGTRVIYWIYEPASAITGTGNSVIIACGPKRVTANRGSWHYKYFTLQTAHSRDEWITIAPGGNQMYINIVGTGTYIVQVGAYNHAWY